MKITPIIKEKRNLNTTSLKKLDVLICFCNSNSDLALDNKIELICIITVYASVPKRNMYSKLPISILITFFCTTNILKKVAIPVNIEKVKYQNNLKIGLEVINQK